MSLVFTSEPNFGPIFRLLGCAGCKPNIYGEHGSKEECVRICSSFVNEGSGCVKTLGVPWNSFSDLSSCRQNT